MPRLSVGSDREKLIAAGKGEPGGCLTVRVVVAILENIAHSISQNPAEATSFSVANASDGSIRIRAAKNSRKGMYTPRLKKGVSRRSPSSI
jgi:hypothetical protein